jgi:hypothetical protein
LEEKIMRNDESYETLIEDLDFIIDLLKEKDETLLHLPYSELMKIAIEIQKSYRLHEIDCSLDNLVKD